MLEIFVDGDACPVKDEAIRVAERHGLKLHLVSNQRLRHGEHPAVHAVVVHGGFDAADDWIVEHVGDDDIVVTGDIPLAARCLEKGARVLGHGGRPFTADSIGMALAMRDLMGHLRDTGEVSGHNASFSKKDRSRFLEAIENAVRGVQRSHAAKPGGRRS